MALTRKQKTIVKRWVAALRSGKYKQGRGSLHDRDNKFCCLGVLCDLAVKSRVIETPTIRGPRGYHYGDEWELLPARVADWVGLRAIDGNFTARNGVSTSLITQNDTRHKNFQQIADLIEREPKGLFV